MAITLNGTTGITTPALDNQGNLTVDGGTIKLDGNYPVGTDNVALGDGAFDAVTSGIQNTAIGANSMTANTSGTNNSAVGRSSLATNTTGSELTALGTNSLTFNTTGSYNTALGSSALLSNTTASYNTAVGYQALQSNTTASYTTAVGYHAGLNYVGTGNSFNTFVGYASGRDTTTGVNNSFFGQQSGISVTTGSNNTILGRYNGNQGGLDIRTSSNNIVLSDGDGNPRMHLDNGVGFHLQGAANAANPYISSYDSSLYAYGRKTSGNGVYLAHNATSWASTSDENRKDIIEPITDAVNKVLQLRTVIGKYKIDEEGTRRPFLIAQDVQAVLPEAVQLQEDNAGEFLGMSYTDIIPLLTAAIKEQQATITALTSRITALEGN